VVNFAQTAHKEALFLDVAVLFLLNFQNCAVNLSTELNLHLFSIQTLDFLVDGDHSVLLFLADVGLGSISRSVINGTVKQLSNLLKVLGLDLIINIFSVLDAWHAAVLLRLLLLNLLSLGGWLWNIRVEFGIFDLDNDRLFSL